jgi:hypothetical protein
LYLTVAILPSPVNEFRDPFSQNPVEDEVPSVSESPLSPRDGKQPSAPTTSGPAARHFLPQHNHYPISSPTSTSSESHQRGSAKDSTVASSGPRDSDISSELDLHSVMRASLAIQEGSHVKNIILKLVHIIMQTAGANYGCIMLREQHSDRKSLYIEVVGNGKVKLVDHKPLHSQTDVVPARLCEYYIY